MITIFESAQILNRSGQHYSLAQAKSIRDFLYKAAELEYSLLKSKEKQTEIKIRKWKDISTGHNELYILINRLRKQGIKVQATEQPIDFRGAFWLSQLMEYLYPSLLME